MAFIFRLLSYLPLSILHAIGALAGRLVYALSERERRLTRENLAIANLGGQVDPRDVLAEAGRTALELPWIWLRTQRELLAKVVKVSGWEHVEHALEVGRGIVFFTPHLGCFEITAQYYASRHPITVLYRRPKQKWLAGLVEHGRGRNLRLAPADVSGVRTLMRALRAREAIGMLPDQVPGNGEGIWVPFFGKPAYTMTLAARLAGSGATVLLAFAERLGNGEGYHLRFLPFPETLGNDVASNAAAINRAIESLVRDCPQQYAWNYNRYKVPAGAPAP